MLYSDLGYDRFWIPTTEFSFLPTTARVNLRDEVMSLVFRRKFEEEPILLQTERSQLRRSHTIRVSPACFHALYPSTRFLIMEMNIVSIALQVKVFSCSYTLSGQPFCKKWIEIGGSLYANRTVIPSSIHVPRGFLLKTADAWFSTAANQFSFI